MRVALYLIVPAITIGASAIALGTVAAPRTLVAVRVWGGPSEVAGKVRLECVRRSVGVDDHVALAGMTLEIDGASTPVSCDAEGHAEAPIARGKGPRRVRVRAGGKTLAEGDVAIGEDAWQAKAVVTPARLRSGGRLAITGYVDGGAIVMGQRGRVVLRTPDELRAASLLRITATGADVKASGAIAGGLFVDLVPTFPNASLELGRVVDPPSFGGWEAPIPIAAAAIGIDELRREGDALVGTLRSSTVRPRAYVVLQDLGARVDARSFALRPDGRGGSFAELTLDASGSTMPGWVIVGTDPSVAGGASWPIADGELTHDGRRVPDARWLDGLTPAHAIERARTGRLTRLVGLLVVLGAALESLLLLDRARRSRRELAEHVARVSEGDAPTLERAGPTLTIVIALAAVLFGFATIGVVFLLSA